jgi:hypothetical protein
MFYRGISVRAIVFAAVVFLTVLPASGQVTKDADSYCAYAKEQALAQKTLFQMPNLEGGISQPTQSVPASAYAGVNSGLSNLRKSFLVEPAANDTCRLYRATVDTQEHILYALPSIERDALTKRLAFTTEAIEELDSLIADAQKKLEARNATLDSIYILQSSKARLEADRATTELTLANISVPLLSDEPLKKLAGAKQMMELRAQEDSAKINKQDNWDVILMVGLRHDAHPLFTSPPGGYGGFNAKWNIGSWKRNRELDQTATDYAKWKEQEDNDVLQSMVLLREQIESAIAAQERALKAMQANEDLIQGNRAKVKGVESSAAALFDNQLVVDELSLRVEIGTTQFRLTRLRQYLADNF